MTDIIFPTDTTGITPALGDLIVIADVSDGENLKDATLQDVVTLMQTNTTTANIADSSNKRYVTDAQLTVIGNTSGTNTGDQNLSWLVPYTGATANVDLGTYDLVTDTARASTSAGMLIESANGTDVWLLGAGNTANATRYGSHNFDTATQDTIAIFTWSGKTLGSAALATYPSLTELSYVKGVTSALQTQIDWKLSVGWGTMTGNITLGENTAIALEPELSDDWKYSGTTMTATAWATLAFAKVVVLDVDDSRRELADVSVAAWSTGDCRWIVGMCVLAAAADWDATNILLTGVVRAASFPTLTVWAPIYATTSWSITQTKPESEDYIIRILGFALTDKSIYFNPSNDYITPN